MLINKIHFSCRRKKLDWLGHLHYHWHTMATEVVDYTLQQNNQPDEVLGFFWTSANGSHYQCQFWWATTVGLAFGGEVPLVWSGWYVEWLSVWDIRTHVWLWLKAILGLYFWSTMLTVPLLPSTSLFVAGRIRWHLFASIKRSLAQQIKDRKRLAFLQAIRCFHLLWHSLASTSSHFVVQARDGPDK